MGTWEGIDNPICELNSYIVELKDRLWKENKIKLQGYTFSEWKKEQESRLDK